MRVQDYEYDENIEGLVSQKRGEELIAAIEKKKRKDSIPHYEILKIGRTDEEFEFMYDYLEENEITIRGINPTMEEMENFKKVSKLGINYYDLPDVIDPAKELELFKKLEEIREDRIAKGQNPLKDEEYKKVRRQIAEGNLRLAKYITTLKPFRNVNMEQDDLFSYGFGGLSDAVDKFDYKKGFKFSTYAWRAIYRRIEREIATEYGVNQNLYLEYRELMDTKEMFLEETDREPTIYDLQNILGLGTKKIINLLRFDEMVVNPDSLEQNIYEDDRETIIDSHHDSGSILDMGDDEYYEDGIAIGNLDEDRDVVDIEYSLDKDIDLNSLKDKINELLKTLNPREAEVLSLRFGLNNGMPHTLEEVGSEYGVTRGRIRQIEAKAIRKLRYSYRAKQIRDFTENL